MKNSRALLERRKTRTRLQLRKRAGGRPRLSVFRSGKHIYAQVINDIEGHTIVSASTREPGLRDEIKNGGTKDAAERVGSLVATRAVEAGVTDVVFDRGGYIFHGRVKALADAAREAGLKF